MALTFTYPPKPERGDAVAVLSLSWGGPAAFPLPFDLGLTRLRDEFGLRPAEYPTTRAAQAPQPSGRRTCTPPSAIPRSRPYLPASVVKTRSKSSGTSTPKS